MVGITAVPRGFGAILVMSLPASAALSAQLRSAETVLQRALFVEAVEHTDAHRSQRVLLFVEPLRSFGDRTSLQGAFDMKTGIECSRPPSSTMPLQPDAGMATEPSVARTATDAVHVADTTLQGASDLKSGMASSTMRLRGGGLVDEEVQPQQFGDGDFAATTNGGGDACAGRGAKAECSMASECSLASACPYPYPYPYPHPYPYPIPLPSLSLSLSHPYPYPKFPIPSLSHPYPIPIPSLSHITDTGAYARAGPAFPKHKAPPVDADKTVRRAASSLHDAPLCSITHTHAHARAYTHRAGRRGQL